jgi:hypothetical protein
MTRVLATIMKWSLSSESVDNLPLYRRFAIDAEARLLDLVTRVLRCLMTCPRDKDTDLLKNYLDGTNPPLRSGHSEMQQVLP